MFVCLCLIRVSQVVFLVSAGVAIDSNEPSRVQQLVTMEMFSKTAQLFLKNEKKLLRRILFLYIQKLQLLWGGGVSTTH